MSAYCAFNRARGRSSRGTSAPACSALNLVKDSRGGQLTAHWQFVQCASSHRPTITFSSSEAAGTTAAGIQCRAITDRVSARQCVPHSSSLTCWWSDKWNIADLPNRIPVAKRKPVLREKIFTRGAVLEATAAVRKDRATSLNKGLSHVASAPRGPGVQSGWTV